MKRLLVFIVSAVVATGCSSGSDAPAPETSTPSAASAAPAPAASAAPASPSTAIPGRLTPQTLQAITDAQVKKIPESHGYTINVMSQSRDLDVSAANGLSDVANATNISTDQPSRIASVTKTFTAATVLRLVEMNKLALSDSIDKHVSPDLIGLLKADGYETSEITIGQLLHHSSGIADYAGNEENYQGIFGQTLAENPTKKWTRAEQVKFAMDAYQPRSKPGAEFHYSDTGYILLGDVIERVSGMSYAEAMRTLLKFKELGLSSTYLENVEPAPAGLAPQAHSYVGDTDGLSLDASYDLFGGGGLVSSVRDVNRFFSALFNNGIFEKPETFDVMLGTNETPVKGADSAGISLYTTQFGSDTFIGHSGFTGISALYCPKKDLAITFTLLQSSLTPEMFSTEKLIAEIVGLV